MDRFRVTAIGAGSLLGTVAGMGRMSEALIFVGFWAGAMWVVWLPVVMVNFISKKAGAERGAIFLGSVAAASVFVAVYALIGLPDGEGSPVTSAGVGMWMVFWSAAALISLFSLFKRTNVSGLAFTKNGRTTHN